MRDVKHRRTVDDNSEVSNLPGRRPPRSCAASGFSHGIRIVRHLQDHGAPEYKARSLLHLTGREKGEMSYSGRPIA